jgi:serine/threonine-protein kinase
VTQFSGDASSAPEARIGQTLSGKWRIDSLLDVGGMGAVYVATHRNGRRCAIKMLHPRFARDPEVRKRFLREGYVANKIGHPGAVAILDDDTTEDGAPFLVMELLEGDSLAALLNRLGGKLPVPDVLAIAGQVLEVLGVAHGHGIIHRDIKPGNVFITRSGHTKLLDFGLARIRDGAVSIIPTAAGVVMGTAGYMAPEQARGTPDQVDGRSDIFAVGAVMFRALTGRRIHEKQSAFDVMLAAMKDQAPSLSTALPGARPLLVQAVDKALAFEKPARWQTARAMFDALHAAYEDARQQPPSIPQGPASIPPQSESVPLELSFSSMGAEESSLIVDVAFGEHHDEEIERERKRMREFGVGLSDMSIAIGPDAVDDKR